MPDEVDPYAELTEENLIWLREQLRISGMSEEGIEWAITQLLTITHTADLSAGLAAPSTEPK